MNLPCCHDSSRRTPGAVWAVVLSLALLLGVRLLALESFEDTAFSRWPQVDAYTYWDQARKMFNGEDPFSGGFYQPPGYPWLLAHVVFPLAGGASLFAIRVFQLALGLVSSVTLLWMGRGLGSWALGLLSLALFSFYPYTLLFELDILTPALSIAGLVLALALVWTPALPAAWRTGLAGLLLGVVAMVHPSFLLCVPALGLALVLWGPAEKGAGGRRPARSRRWGAALGLCTLLGGTLLGLSPTAWQNWSRWEQLALVSHNAGINFYLGNNPDWRRTVFLRPGIPFRQLVLEAEPHRRDQFQRNSFWWKRAREEISRQPMAFVDALATKVIWSFNAREIPRNEEYLCRLQEPELAWLAFSPVRYWWAFPLAAWGVCVLWRRRARGRLVVLQWVALQSVMWVFLVADRYRMAAWPLLCIAASAGTADLWKRLQEPRGGRALRWPIVVMALAAILPWWPLAAPARFQPAWCEHLRGNLSLSDGRYDDAMGYYQKTILVDPSDLSARRWLAQALLLKGRPAEARETLLPVLERFPEHYPSEMLMVQICERLEDWSAAAEYAGVAYHIPGDRTRTGLRYIRLLVKAGHLQVARDVALADPRLAGRRDIGELLGL